MVLCLMLGKRHAVIKEAVCQIVPTTSLGEPRA